MTAVEAPRWVSRAPKLGFVGSFDGIRGIGVMMVLVGHALFEYLESWVTIVDTFFVLSGFLIATLLLQEDRSTGSISISKFYQRRAIRLLPSVWLFVSVWIVLGAIAQALGIEGITVGEVLKDAGAAVTYVYHVVFPNGLYMIEPGRQDQRTMWHLWTLGVEEHFYLIIPGLTLLCLRRRWIRALGVGMAVVALAIGVARLLAYTGPVVTPGTWPGVRLAFLQRPDALMLGVALAVFNAHVDEDAAARLRRPFLAAAHVCLIVWLAVLNLSSGVWDRLGLPHFKYLPDGPREATREAMVGEAYWFRFGHSLGAIAFAFICFAMVRYQDWWFSRFLSWSPFRWMGRLSYTVYVWHALPYVVLLALTGGDDASKAMQLARTPVLIVAAIAVSIPVYYKVELRVMEMKLRFASEKETLDLNTGRMISIDEARSRGSERP